MNAADFDVFATLLRDRSGLAIGTEKLYLLETRLHALLRREKLANLSALAASLRAPGAFTLADDVVEAMTTNESFFFRDGKPFAHLRDALPALAATRAAGAAIRMWSAASAAGQEAYSLAMIVADHAAALEGRSVEIIGTDISRAQVARAASGRYSQFEIQRGLPMPMLVRHFRKEGAEWRAAPELRARVAFRVWNLLSDLRPLGRFDVVFCRNVLLYFDAPTKSRALAAIGRQMAPDGLLYLGAAETVVGVTSDFTPLPGGHGVYGLKKKTLRAA